MLAIHSKVQHGTPTEPDVPTHTPPGRPASTSWQKFVQGLALQTPQCLPLKSDRAYVLGQCVCIERPFLKGRAFCRGRKSRLRRNPYPDGHYLIPRGPWLAQPLTRWSCMQASVLRCPCWQSHTCRPYRMSEGSSLLQPAQTIRPTQPPEASLSRAASTQFDGAL